MYGLNELMQYFVYQNLCYYIIPIVLLYNIFRVCKQKHTDSIRLECALDLLMGLALCAGLVFQGALIDITNGAYIQWLYQLIGILVISIALAAAHILLMFRLQSK